MTRPRPSISVIIPAHDAEPYILDAVDSVLSQDFADLEILVINDGSTDRTAELVTSTRDPRVRLVDQDRQGVVAAANRGFAESQGRYIARLDADDLMSAGRLRSQIQFLDSHPDVVVCGTDYELFGAATGRVRMPRSDRACRQRLLLATCFAQPSVMIRKGTLDRHDLRYRESTDGLGEDYQLWCEISAFGRLANLPLIGLRYRVHSGQTSVRKWDALVSSYSRIAQQHAHNQGRTALTEREAAALMAPRTRSTGAGGSRMSSMLPVVRSAAKAFLRAPGLETGRFVARCSLERFHELRSPHG